MAVTNLNRNKAAKDEHKDQAVGDQQLAPALHIYKEAQALQKIAEENNHDFLSHILKMAVLETEDIIWKRDLGQRCRTADADSTC